MVARLSHVVIGMSLVLPTASTWSQSLDDFFVERVKLVPLDLVVGDQLGLTASVMGDIAVVGAPKQGEDNTYTGSAYVYERVGDFTWIEIVKITALVSEVGAEFGSSVSVWDDTILIGAYRQNVDGFDSGTVFVFEREIGGSWTETGNFSAEEPEAYARFGCAISLEGDTALVGAEGADVDGASVGLAYIFTKHNNAWTQEAILSSLDGQESDSFGYSVSLSGDVALVGAPFDDDNGDWSGSAYIFELQDGEWTQVAKLLAPDGAELDYFGQETSLSGDVALISAWQHESQGAAYVFERQKDGSWPFAAKLTPSDIEMMDNFGLSVSLHGHSALVGASSDDDGGSGAGAAYVFERQGGEWVEVMKLTASDALPSDSFGKTVSSSEDALLICAPHTEDNGHASGSCYVFEYASAINMDSMRMYPNLQDAIDEADSGGDIAIRSKAFDLDAIVNQVDKKLEFITVDECVFASDLMLLTASDTVFSVSPDTGDLDNPYTIKGQLVAPFGGVLTFEELRVQESGQLLQNDSTLLFNDSMNTVGGSAYLRGDVLASVVSTAGSGSNRIAGDTNVFADYENDGTTLIHRGILYIYGNLTNNGTLAGDYNTGPGFAGGEAPEPGDGISIGGDYTVGQGAKLSMPDPVWWLRVGGDLDVAIDHAARFSMAEATIQMTGIARGELQNLEAMCANLGAVDAGFDPSNFPLGALRITSDSTTQLVNNHPNATNDACEVLYVNEVHVAFGGKLITNGCPIYARSATIDGTVDDPDAIIIVEDTPECPGDIDGDGVVSGADLALVLGAWGSNDAAADVSGDGTVDGVDLAIVLGAWGACAG